jgi:hypothetical protein
MRCSAARTAARTAIRAASAGLPSRCGARGLAKAVERRSSARRASLPARRRWDGMHDHRALCAAVELNPRFVITCVSRGDG